MAARTRSRSFGNLVQTRLGCRASSAALTGRRSLKRRDHGERAGQRQQIARAGGGERDLREQPFQIENRFEMLARGPRAGSAQPRQFLHGIQARFDFGDIDRRREQTAAKQAAAHAGASAVEHVEQRRILGLAREQRLDQFQIANGGGVEDQSVGAIVERRALQMIERGALGIAQIVQNRGGGAGGERARFEAAAVEREQVEMIAQAARGVIGREDPGVDVGFEAGQGIGAILRRTSAASRAFRVSSAARTSAASISVARNSPVETSTCATPARPFDGHDGGQVVVLVRAQHLRVHRGAGRDDAGDFAPDQFVAAVGVFHLIADGDAVALLDQPRDVVFGGMIGDAAHRNRLALFLVAGGERDLELAGGGDGVVVEQLVEIAQPEHQQRVGDLLLDAVVLPHQRRGGLG